MSTEAINVFCQVGFAQKNWWNYYFHKVDGKPYGWALVIDDAEEYLDPYSLEELLCGTIPFDQLPDELQDTIVEFAGRAIATIERMDPVTHGQIVPNDIQITFTLYDEEWIGDDNVDYSGELLN